MVQKSKRNEISNPNAMALSTVGAFNKPRTGWLMKEIRKMVLFLQILAERGNHIENKNVS